MLQPDFHIYIKVTFLLFMAINAGDKWENDRGGSRISDGGGGTKGGSANLSFGQIFQTLHKNEESGPAGGGEGGVQNVSMYIYH